MLVTFHKKRKRSMLVTSFFFSDKRRSNESEKKLVPGSVRTSSELAERNPNPNEDLEFPSIQFSDIVAATNNFSRACMIGRGGFGKVYKVTLRSAAYISFSKSELMN